MGAFLPALLENEILAGGADGTIQGLKPEIEKLTPSADFSGEMHIMRYGALRILSFSLVGSFSDQRKTIVTLDEKDRPPVDMTKEMLGGSLDPMELSNKGIVNITTAGKVNTWVWGDIPGGNTFNGRSVFPWLVIDEGEGA